MSEKLPEFYGERISNWLRNAQTSKWHTTEEEIATALRNAFLSNGFTHCFGLPAYQNVAQFRELARYGMAPDITEADARVELDDRNREDARICAFAETLILAEAKRRFAENGEEQWSKAAHRAVENS